jgi:hypothetical protein
MGRGGYGLLRIASRSISSSCAATPSPSWVSPTEPSCLRWQRGPASRLSTGRWSPSLAACPRRSCRPVLAAGIRRAKTAARRTRNPSPGQCHRPTLGGNLEVFSRLLGTPLSARPRRRYLVSRRSGRASLPHRSLLTHLELAGVFSRRGWRGGGRSRRCEEPPNRA